MQVAFNAAALNFEGIGDVSVRVHHLVKSVGRCRSSRAAPPRPTVVVPDHCPHVEQAGRTYGECAHDRHTQTNPGIAEKHQGKQACSQSAETCACSA